jgi:hypothetical protein
MIELLGYPLVTLHRLLPSQQPLVNRTGFTQPRSFQPLTYATLTPDSADRLTLSTNTPQPQVDPEEEAVLANVTAFGEQFGLFDGRSIFALTPQETLQLHVSKQHTSPSEVDEQSIAFFKKFPPLERLARPMELALAPKRLYHGRSPKTLQAIYRDGFRLPPIKNCRSSRVLGRGIYFAEQKEKAAQYGSVGTFQLKPSTRIGSFNLSFWPELGSFIEEAVAVMPLSRAEQIALRHELLSRFFTSQGFDAIYASSEKYPADDQVVVFHPHVIQLPEAF